MSSPEPIRLGGSDLVDLLREAGALMAGGMTPIAAARQVLDGQVLDPELAAELQALGLARRLGDSLGHWRHGSETPVRPRLTTLPPLELALVGADGILKSLREFTAADCHALLTEARAQRGAWQARIKLAGRMLTLLERNKADRLGDLPDALVAELNSEVLEVWA